jgi:lysophospholipase L1-like esterase
MMRTTTEAFLRIVRAGHPGVPIVVASPVVRPDAEATPNKLGATLADLRRAMEEAATAVADDLLTLVPGGEVLDAALLADGVHPGDEGHRVLADVFGSAVRAAYDSAAATKSG